MGSLSRSEKKRQRLAALEKKEAKKKPLSNKSVSVEKKKLDSLPPPKEKDKQKHRRGATESAFGPSQNDTDDKKEEQCVVTDDTAKSMIMYASFDKASDIYPWTEGDRRTLDDVVHDLLLTNPKYKVGRGDVADKMKEKTLMLDNPDVKRKARIKGRFLKNAGVAKATRKELCALGAVDVSKMNLTYDDACELHQVWKEYRDAVMESCVTRKDVEAAVSSMDKHGVDLVVTKASDERYVGLHGIILGDSSTVLHVLDAQDGRHVMIPKRGTEYAFEISKGRRIKICC